MEPCYSKNMKSIQITEWYTCNTCNFINDKNLSFLVSSSFTLGGSLSALLLSFFTQRMTVKRHQVSIHLVSQISTAVKPAGLQNSPEAQKETINWSLIRTSASSHIAAQLSMRTGLLLYKAWWNSPLHFMAVFQFRFTLPAAEQQDY